MWGKSKAVQETIQCSLTKSPTVFLESIASQKIQLLMAEYTHQEWLAYMVGKISKKENVFVEDISVPPHKEANGASAEAEPFHIPDKCVGIIHSHHSMGAFHSGTDQAYVDKNFPVSITVARNGSSELSYDAVSYAVTPCGKAMTTKCPVKYVQPQPSFDTDKFIKEAKANIDKGKEVNIVHKEMSLEGYMGGKESYVPIRYRESYVTDKSGKVLCGKELDDIVQRIQKEGASARVV